MHARAPLLPGHGEHARALSQTRWNDWCLAVETELSSLAEAGPVVVAGLSLGSLLAMQLALTHPEKVRALVLLANALWLSQPFPAWPLGVLEKTSRGFCIGDVWSGLGNQEV